LQFKSNSNFSLFCSGRKGFPSYSAPLSDPNAVPNDALLRSVDECFRTICTALIADNAETHDADMKSIANVIVSEGGKEFSGGVINSLAYMRDRVGVPRDMR